MAATDLLAIHRQRLILSIFEKLKIENPDLRKIMSEVPRHAFVDSALHESSYQDNALPIGLGQTISQPSIVAMMTHALSPKTDDKILEIGTGSGYQAAVLAKYTRRLYTVERHADLSNRAQNILRGLGYHNIIFKIGDGSQGWESWAPFDGIIVTAGAPVVPNRLKQQLADGGRLIIPAGERSKQSLLRITRHGNEFSEKVIADCRFVPLVGRGGWGEDE